MPYAFRHGLQYSLTGDFIASSPLLPPSTLYVIESSNRPEIIFHDAIPIEGKKSIKEKGSIPMNYSQTTPYTIFHVNVLLVVPQDSGIIQEFHK